MFERMGGTLIKIGQQLSMRVDMLPYAYCMELSKLLDNVAPVPVNQAIATIERATGKPLAETFARFDPEPIGSASVACVYQAILKTGEKVARMVKAAVALLEPLPHIELNAFKQDLESLRATWAPCGQQVRVHISGRNQKRVLFGALDLMTGQRELLSRTRHRALDLMTGQRELLSRTRHRALDFCAFRRWLRKQYGKIPLTLMLDEDPSHTAKLTRIEAERLDIELLSLPHRSPELNPLESMWRHVKQVVCANRQYPDILTEVLAVLYYPSHLSDAQALQLTGILSPTFWLRHVRSKLICGPT